MEEQLQEHAKLLEHINTEHGHFFKVHAALEKALEGKPPRFLTDDVAELKADVKILSVQYVDISRQLAELKIMLRGIGARGHYSPNDLSLPGKYSQGQ